MALPSSELRFCVTSGGNQFSVFGRVVVVRRARAGSQLSARPCQDKLIVQCEHEPTLRNVFRNPNHYTVPVARTLPPILTLAVNPLPKPS